MPARQVRASEGPACQVRFSEGPACRVRCATLDYPFHFVGHDEHAPPIRRDAPPNAFDKTEGAKCTVACRASNLPGNIYTTYNGYNTARSRYALAKRHVNNYDKELEAGCGQAGGCC